MSNITKQTKIGLKVSIYFCLFLLVVSLFVMRNNWSTAGAWMGRLSIYVFWLIAIAGILKRFRVKGFLNRVQQVLMANRRQLGILMFMLGLTHFLWSKVFDNILNGSPQSIPTYQPLGLLALFLCLPLAITSNRFSVKKLGKFWQILHYLVYPVMFLLAFHTSLQGKDFQAFGIDFSLGNTVFYGLPSLTILILQIVSHFYDKKMKTRAV